jgi:hypothetical protein
LTPIIIFMRALLIVVPILSPLIGCAAPERKLPATASATGTQGLPDTALASRPQHLPDTAASEDTLPSGYTLTDTTSWGTALEDGQRAVLRRGEVMIDTVDLFFGVAAVGQDSLVFLPVRTDTAAITGGSVTWHESYPTEHVFWTLASRRELRAFLPFFNAYFSSPTIARESVIHYWGMERDGSAYRLHAIRYDFRTARLDSLFLNRDSAGTDYRYHFRPPRVQGNEVSFGGSVLDATTWRVIRRDPPPD